MERSSSQSVLRRLRQPREASTVKLSSSQSVPRIRSRGEVSTNKVTLDSEILQRGTALVGKEHHHLKSRSRQGEQTSPLLLPPLDVSSPLSQKHDVKQLHDPFMNFLANGPATSRALSASAKRKSDGETSPKCIKSEKLKHKEAWLPTVTDNSRGTSSGVNGGLHSIVQEEVSTDTEKSPTQRGKLGKRLREVLQMPSDATASTGARISQAGAQYTIDRSGSKKQVPPAKWGITLDNIVAFWQWCKTQDAWHKDMSVRELVKQIIKPNYTQGQSVALTSKLFHQTKPIRYLVSHSWEETAEDFFEDLQGMLESCAADDGIFVCFLCVFQGTDEEISLQVTQNSSNIEDGCFAQILENVKKDAGALCVISNENLVRNGQGLYSRLWCGWEAYQAKKNDVRILLHPKRCTPQHLFGQGDINAYTLRNGHCGDPNAKSKADKQNEAQIRRAIGKSWARVDAKIKIAMINSWNSDSAGLVPFLGDADKETEKGVFEAVLLAFQNMGVRAEEHSSCLAEHFWKAPERVASTLMAMRAAGAAEVFKFLDLHDKSTAEYAAAWKSISSHLMRHKPILPARTHSR